ncbi:nuclear transport factor 2 family protein [Pseudaminobacter salicylatoxidans]|uniref:nuclear transport factor 2 family protein n=1 Tax=Pseudaminobacter salicylatoxidans TaxID=93369 RepID=UPI00035CA1AB|nr:nuclear transport factor 2 family protein [Pseudaminobacter salicylatoxidans]
MTPEDRMQIELQCMRLVTAFAVNLDLRSYDEVVALFAPDAVYRPRHTTFRGQEGVRAYLQSRPHERISRHIISNCLIDVLGPDEARGYCVLTYFVDEGGTGGGEPAPLAGAKLVGDYHDRFVRTPEGWRITERIGEIVFERK